MLRKYARLYVPDSDNDGSGNTLQALTSLDAEISQFNGSNKFPSFDETPANDPKPKETSDETASTEKVEKVEKEKPKSITNVEDFNKILPDASDTAKKLGNNNKPAPKAADGDETNNSQLEDKTSNDETAEIKKPTQRDYTGFSDQEVKLLKRMSNDAFDYVAPKLKEQKALEQQYKEQVKTLEVELTKAKEGKVTIPDNYYENPQAVYLTPEVQQLQQTISTATAIENHWKQQLLNIEMGKDWTDLIEDPKTGQIYVSSKTTPSGAIGSEEWVKNKYAVNEYYGKTQRQSLEIQQQLNNYVSTFKQRHEGMVKSIQQAESQYMPMFNDTKSEEYKKYELTSAEVAKLGISKTNPAFNMLAKSIALNLIMRDVIVSGMQNVNKTEQLKQQQAKAGPTMATFSGGDAGRPNSKAPSLEDFAKLGLR